MAQKFSMTNLSSNCQKLFDSYIQEDEKVISASLEELFATCGLNKQLAVLNDYTSEEKKKIVDSLVWIGQFLQTQTQILVSSPPKKTTTLKKEQKEEKLWTHGMQKTSLVEIFTIMAREHFHNLQEKANVFVCTFHAEPLFVHSHLALLRTFKALPKNMPIEQIRFHLLTALLHDIGKMECVQKIDDKKRNKKNVAFHFHGEMGAGILQQMWLGSNGGYQKFFTQQEWENLCQTVSRHMCGYTYMHTDVKEAKEEKNTDTRSANSANGKFCLDMLKLENNEVKQNLGYLSVGDNYGKINMDEKKIPTLEFFNSRQQFAEEITKNLDVLQFYNNNDIGGLLVLLRGMSGSGKSRYYQQQLKTLFDQMKVEHVFINRDEVLCQVVAQELKEQVPVLPIDSKVYNRYRKVYEEKDLGKTVNAEISSMFEEAFASNKVVVLDTLVNLFGVEFLLPTCAKLSYVVAIDIIRGEPITQAVADRMGITLNKQFELHSQRTLLNWLPKNAKCKDLTARTTRSDPLGLANVSPYSSFQVSWNNNGYIGNSECLRQLGLLLEPIAELQQKHQPLGDMFDNCGIVEYVNKSYKKHGFERMCQLLRNLGFDINTTRHFYGTPYGERIVVIKYRETCHVWKTKWAREARGVILALTNNNVWVNLKYLLQRGAEVLTGMQMKADFSETQDYKVGHIDYFDERQQDLIYRLAKNKPVNLRATFKVDGSLLGFSFYTGEMAEMVCYLITTFGDAFAKLNLKIVEDLKLPFVPVLSSQGTLFCGDDMIDYYVTSCLTSIIGGKPIVEYNTLVEEVKNSSIDKIWEKYGQVFYQKLNMTYTKLVQDLTELKHDTDVVTFSFEAVCQNRTTVVNKVHRELAVSYPTSMLKCLGASWGKNHPLFLPHMVIADYIALSGIQEPLWFTINHSNEMEAMMSDLSTLMRTKNRDEKTFLEKYKPNNKYPVFNYNLDFEGFVTYAVFTQVANKYVMACVDEKNDVKLNTLADWLSVMLDYSKVKTDEYYKSHKFHEEEIPYLAKLSETASDIFPLCKLVTNFYTSLPNALQNVVNSITVELKQDEKKFISTLPEKAQTGFDKRPMDVRIKMLVNQSEYWSLALYNNMIREFVDLKNSQTDKTHVMSTLKGVMMNLQFWAVNNLQANIAKLIKNNDASLVKLFSIILNQG